MLATPFTSGIGPPMFVVLSLNCTVPVGSPAPSPVAVTVAVNVTAWPHTLGFNDVASVVVVRAAFTVCGIAADVLVAKPASPTYFAVIECDVNTDRLPVVNVALSPFSSDVPILLPPSKNSTDPV